MISSAASNPSTPLADPIPMAAPGDLFWVLLILTFCLHLIAMNFVLGGSLIALANYWRQRETSVYGVRLSRDIAGALPICIAAAVSFGVAPLLFLQVLYGRLFYTSSILMGWYWWGVVPLLIIAYYGAYALAFSAELKRRTAFGLRLLTSLLFAAIAFLYVNNMTLMLRPSAFSSMYAIDSTGWSLNLSDGTLFPRFVHILLGALAVAGLAVVAGGIVARRNDRFYGSWLVQHGLRWFLGATAVNFLAGTWLLLSFPVDFLLGFVQKGMPGPAILASAICMGLLSFGLAFLAFQSKGRAGLLAATGVCTLLTIVSMVLVRDQVRETMLSLAGFQPTGWVKTQGWAIGIFFLLLGLSICVILWMAVKLFSSQPRR